MLSAAAAFLGATFRQQTTYTVANLSGLFTNVMFLVFRAGVLEASFGHTDRIGGMTPLQATGFAAITQALLMVVPAWGQMGLAADVRSGQIAVALLRPVDPFVVLLAQRLGISLFYVFGRMLPILGLALAAGLLPLPSPTAALLFPVSLLLGAVVAIEIWVLLECSAFWLQTDMGVRQLVLGVSTLASGLLLPLSWYPDALQRLFWALPFSSTLAIPTELWLGMRGPEALLQQLGWVVLLAVAGRGALALGLRRLTINGG